MQNDEGIKRVGKQISKILQTLDLEKLERFGMTKATVTASTEAENRNGDTVVHRRILGHIRALEDSQ